MKLITEKVVPYPVGGDYDINVWCDNDTHVSLTFYPLYKGSDGNLHVNTKVFYTLPVSLKARGPKQRRALAYIKNLVNAEDTFDEIYTDWWSNECVLFDPPKLIADFVKKLPRSS
jgi:hypothetical protein